MNTVALILDPDFGQRIERLAQEMPVWVLSSRLNDPAIESARSILKDRSSITSFVPKGAPGRPAVCDQVLYDIDEHHGPWSSSPPYEGLLVFGAVPADFSPATMEELGLEPAGVEKDAFILRKHHVARTDPGAGRNS